jgi:riboflavin-specific deaminase-like protein
MERVVTVPRAWQPRPWVIVNMAMTADGKIATANRRVHTFGSPRDLAHLYALRSTADAVLCGAVTGTGAGVVLGPGPARYRQARVKRGLAESNLRVLVSGSGRLDLTASVFQRRFSPVLVLTTERAGAKRIAAIARVASVVAICGREQIDFHAALGWLRSAWGVQRLVCEGGGELNDAMFRSGLVDELYLTICPFIFGGRTAPTVADGAGVQRLAEAAQLRLKSVRRVGAELFCRFEAERGKPGAV